MSTIKIYQDSKEIPFWNYKRIDQTGDYLYMIKGYEAGDQIEADIEALKAKYEEIEQDYAVSINVKNEDIVKYGQMAVSIHEFNKYTLILKMIDLVLETTLAREYMGLDPSEEFNEALIFDMLKGFKIAKCDNLPDQRDKVLEKIDKHKNQIAKLEKELKKDDVSDSSEFDLTEQFVSLQVGLEMPIDDKQISLYEFGLYVKKLIERVEQSNKMMKNVR